MHKHKPSFDDACRLFVVRKWVRVDDEHGRRSRAQLLWASISNLKFLHRYHQNDGRSGLGIRGCQIKTTRWVLKRVSHWIMIVICRCNKSADYGEDQIDSISRLARRSGDCLPEHQNGLHFTVSSWYCLSHWENACWWTLDSFVGRIVIWLILKTTLLINHGNFA